jgi:hypothetical protein
VEADKQGSALWLCLPLAFTLVSSLAYSLTLKKKMTYSSETSVDFQRTTCYHIPEGSVLSSYHRENLKFVELLLKVFLNMMPCRLVVKYRRFGITCCLYFGVRIEDGGSGFIGIIDTYISDCTVSYNNKLILKLASLRFLNSMHFIYLLHR